MQRVLLACSVLLAACTYDFSNVQRLDAGAGASDSGRLCDPIANAGCVGGGWCSVFTIPGADARVTCSTTGGASIPGDPCTGTGICRPDLLCRGTGPGSGVCSAWCTDTTECSSGGSCNRAVTLFTHGATNVHPCE